MYVEDVGYLLQNPMLSARDIQEGRLSPGSMPKKFIKSTVTSTHANMYDYREDYPQVSAQNTASRGFVFVICHVIICISKVSYCHVIAQNPNF